MRVLIPENEVPIDKFLFFLDSRLIVGLVLLRNYGNNSLLLHVPVISVLDLPLNIFLGSLVDFLAQ